MFVWNAFIHACLECSFADFPDLDSGSYDFYGVVPNVDKCSGEQFINLILIHSSLYSNKLEACNIQILYVQYSYVLFCTHAGSSSVVESSNDTLLPYTLLLPASLFSSKAVARGGTTYNTPVSYPVYVGVRQLAQEERALQYRYPERGPSRPYNYKQQFTASYTLRAFVTSCYYRDLGHALWNNAGCQVHECTNSILERYTYCKTENVGF